MVFKFPSNPNNSVILGLAWHWGSLAFSNSKFEADTQRSGRNKMGKVWVSLITGQLGTKQMHCSAADGISSEAPARLQELCSIHGTYSNGKLIWQRTLVLFSQLWCGYPGFTRSCRCSELSVKNYLKLNFQTAFPLSTPTLPWDCLKDVVFPVPGTQF